jgi:hypothetical protein
MTAPDLLHDIERPDPCRLPGAACHHGRCANEEAGYPRCRDAGTVPTDLTARVEALERKLDTHIHFVGPDSCWADRPTWDDDELAPPPDAAPKWPLLPGTVPVPSPAPEGDEAAWAQLTAFVVEQVHDQARGWEPSTRLIIAKAIELGLAAPAGSIPPERLVVTDAAVKAATERFRQTYSMEAALNAALAHVTEADR